MRDEIDIYLTKAGRFLQWWDIKRPEMERIIIDTHKLLKKFIPESIEIFKKRYTILQSIYINQPIGRRSLATLHEISERTVRSETDFLKEAGFISADAIGMMITSRGEAMLEGLRNFSDEIFGISELEREVQFRLGLEKVLIVSGDVDDDVSVQKELGRAAANYLMEIISNDSVIAVTGGSTMASVAKSLSQAKEETDIVVIPARGGMGREVENQSNIIASIFAKRLGGQYRMLHVPDQLGAEAAETLLNEPDIQEVIRWLKNAQILVYGIGRAEDMAVRRNLPSTLKTSLRSAGAVAEAFGYYFNSQGEVVYASNCIGLRTTDLKKIPKRVGVAGGRQKAEAIAAVYSHWGSGVLITDEGAARQILNFYRTKSQ